MRWDGMRWSERGGAFFFFLCYRGRLVFLFYCCCSAVLIRGQINRSEEMYVLAAFVFAREKGDVVGR